MLTLACSFWADSFGTAESERVMAGACQRVERSGDAVDVIVRLASREFDRSGAGECECGGGGLSLCIAYEQRMQKISRLLMGTYDCYN